MGRERDATGPPALSTAEALALAAAVTVCAGAIGRWYPLWALRPHWIPGGYWAPALRLLLGLLLVLPAPRRYGLVIGDIRRHWKGVLLVCGGPVLLTALVYPRLPVRPFEGASSSMWALSPLAQDLIFIGWMYGFLERRLPPRVHRRIPVTGALLAGAIFFAAWHLPNLAGRMPTGYVLFQLAYTAAGYLVVGLSRQWTGSLLYATLAHSAGNAIAWATS